MSVHYEFALLLKLLHDCLTFIHDCLTTIQDLQLMFDQC